MYENNYKALNLITTVLSRNVYDHVSHLVLSRNVYDHVSHLKTDHDVWLKLCNTYKDSYEIKSSHKDTFNR
jgi:hypothetical protein